MSDVDSGHGDPFAPQMAAAEALLSAGLSRDIRVTGAERLTQEGRRNMILRCAVAGASGDGPTSIIIKQAVSHDPRRRFSSEWAGAEFLETIAGPSRYGPRFYGGDRSLGLIVLEDLGEHRSLVEPLLQGDAAAAEQALLVYAARLGGLHADTIGAAARFEAIMRAIDPTSAVDTATSCRRQAAKLRERASLLPGLLARLGAAAVTGLDADLDTICEALAHPGPFLAYIHGDACPDNVFYEGGRLRLIDFELGRFGHALRDGVYGRMQFPTCWCANRLPAAVVHGMERSYRAELARGCPAAQDDRSFENALVVMSGSWLVSTLADLLGRAIDEDLEWGITTLRPRILARLEAFVAAATAFDDPLPALRGTAEALLAPLARRWPDGSPLPLYPAFRG